MSGGHLIVLDQAGRDSKRYSLPDGLATLGSDHSCDIRILLPTISPHHATVVVRANQTLVRAVCGETRVNGAVVSVAALRHGDVLALGGRRLRWEYRDAAASRPLEPESALVVRALRSAGRRASAGAAGGGAGARRERHLQLAAQLASRASMPAGAGALGKQVAIVQPQRRDAGPQRDASPRTPGSARRARASGVPSPPPPPWGSPRQGSPRAPAARRAPPLRAAVLRRTLPPATTSATKPRVTKIQAPSVMDHTKQAAFMLMMGHTPKGESPAPGRGSKRPSLPVGKRSSLAGKRSLPAGKRSLPGGKRSIVAVKRSQSASPRVRPQAQPERSPSFRTSRRSAASVIEITGSTIRPGDETERSPLLSPPPRSPKKSALKDPKSNSRKIESIKFDLSNLESASRRDDSEAEEAEALLYPDSPPSPPGGRPSPRAPAAPATPAGTPPAAASPRRGAARSRRNLETYSIVDLVSLDSNASGPTVYDSADSSVVSFGTPRPGSGARRSADPTLVASSTPYAGRAGRPRAAGASRASSGAGDASTGGRTTRSESLMTPENALGVPLPSGRVPRATKSRSRIDESDPLRSDTEDASPLSSRRAGVVVDVADDTYVESGETTPVLSIRSLLDSSREAPARGERATRSEPRGGERARRPVRRTLLRLSGEAPGAEGSPGARGARAGRRATPPGPARPSRPSPSPVKNKHSTAKKPVSKRSLLDHLERSDVVKTLFHSPVKRRLSRSMVEFSKRLTEEDEAPRKRARNTIAAPARAGGGAPPARAAPASPPRTPARSPAAGGGKRLFPPSAARPPAPARRSLRTPRPAGGGARAGAASRRSDKISAPSPRNDYRNVSAQRKPRAPGNDLSDFRGVRELFRERRGPRDDLTDVGGVKRAFGRAPADDLSDVSGVARLFDAPDAPDAPDRLPAAPRPGPPARRTPARRDTSRPGDAARPAAELTKPPSEVFPAHRLPIKKRSLVVGGGEVPPPLPLPLKKRALTHSTPLKGRGRSRGRGRGSSAARVSPIPPSAPGRITMDEISIIKSVEDKPKTEEQKREPAMKPSPRKTRGRGKDGALVPAPVSEPAPAAPPRRSGRRGAADSMAAPTTKRRKVSLVLTKKPIVLSPKAVSPKLSRRGRGAAKPAPPALVRGPERAARARRHPPATPAAPKTTRAKVSETVTAPLEASPPPEPRAKRTRRKAAPPPPAEAPRAGRARRNEPKIEAPEPKKPPIKEQPKTKRGRRAAAPDANADVAEPQTRSKRGKKTAETEAAPPAASGAGRGRKRKVAVEAPTPPKVRAVEAGGRPARGARGRAAAPAGSARAAGKAAEATEVEARPKRGNRAQVVVESEPKARAARGGAAAPAQDGAGRSRRR